MSPEEKLSDFEIALAALAPRAEKIDRDQLMFLAGQASVGPHEGGRAQGWIWPGAFALMTCVAATLLVMILVRPAPQLVERPNAQRIPAAVDHTAPVRPDEASAIVAENSVDDSSGDPPETATWLAYWLNPADGTLPVARLSQRPFLLGAGDEMQPKFSSAEVSAIKDEPILSLRPWNQDIASHAIREPL